MSKNYQLAQLYWDVISHDGNVFKYIDYNPVPQNVTTCNWKTRNILGYGTVCIMLTNTLMFLIPILV